MKIGVLAMQGAFAEHISAFQKLGVAANKVRLREDLADISGLVIPGGESTTISRLLRAYDLMKEIQQRAASGMPVFGTCAGMILMAKDVINNNTLTLGLMNITVQRNAFGRQLESFESDVSIPELGEQKFPAVFIRAPLIQYCDNNVQILARLADDTIVAARQDNLLVTSFHPELTDDTRLHRYFLTIVSQAT